MKTEDFNEQMEAEGLTPEAQINEIMATLPPIYYAGKGGYAIEHKGGFIPLPNETQVKQHLAMAGVTKELMTPLICHIRTENYVGYIGPVAGHKAGLHRSKDTGQSILVTYGPKILEGEEGKTPFIDKLLAGFIGEGLQCEALKAWWRQARRNVKACERRPLPAAVLIGPPDSGKTLVLEISRVILGGRSASAFQYLAGKTEFNGDIIGAELTTVDDEIAHGDYKARTSFGQAIKRDHFASSVRLRKMYHEALVLRPVQTLAIAVNNEAEHLQVLPTVDNSLRDKLSLFWCGKAHLSGLTDRGKIWKQIESELPALCHYLDSTDHPEILRHPRTGCAAWQSLEALEALEAISPEERLVELIGQCSSVKAGWRGTSAELEQQLTYEDITRRGAEKLLRWDGACGSILSKLERSGRIDISSTTVQGNRTWTIKSLQRAKAGKEDSAAAYSVRGWSGGPKSDFYKQEGEKRDNTMEKPETIPTTPPPEGGTGGEVPKTVPTPLATPAVQSETINTCASGKVWKSWYRVIDEINHGEGCGHWLAMPVRLEKDEGILTITINFVDGPGVVSGEAGKYYTDYLPEVWQHVTGETIEARFKVAPEPTLDNFDDCPGILGALERFDESLNAEN